MQGANNLKKQRQEMACHGKGIVSMPFMKEGSMMEREWCTMRLGEGLVR